MRELLDEFEADAAVDEQLALTEGAGENVAALLQNQLKLEDHIIDLQRRLKEREAQLKHMREETIPEAFAAAGMGGFTMSQGWEVEVAPFVHTSFTQKMDAEKREKALAWLRETDNDSLIKNTVSVSFGKGEDAKSQALVEHLREQGLTPKEAETIAASSLQKFIRLELEANRDVPLDLFNAYTGVRSTIKRPKVKV